MEKLGTAVCGFGASSGSAVCKCSRDGKTALLSVLAPSRAGVGEYAPK